MGNDDERPKKSWREIDRARESGQRREGTRERDERNDRSASYRAYKSQLDRLFDGGASRANDGGPSEDELGKLLDASDDKVVLDALDTIERMRGEGRLKRAAALKARLQTVLATNDHPEVQKKTRALLSQL